MITSDSIAAGLNTFATTFRRLVAAQYLLVLGSPEQTRLVSDLVDGKLTAEQAAAARDVLDKFAERITP